MAAEEVCLFGVWQRVRSEKLSERSVAEEEQLSIGAQNFGRRLPPSRGQNWALTQF
jgi:hypothetical protein